MWIQLISCPGQILIRRGETWIVIEHFIHGFYISFTYQWIGIIRLSSTSPFCENSLVTARAINVSYFAKNMILIVIQMNSLP